MSNDLPTNEQTAIAQRDSLIRLLSRIEVVLMEIRDVLKEDSMEL